MAGSLVSRADRAALAQRYRPIYRFHSEEMWYPCHPEDQLRCADLVRVHDGAIVIPALGALAGSPADQLLCTPLGLDQLHARGITLDPVTIAALQWKPTATQHYAWLAQDTGHILVRSMQQAALMPPYGYIASMKFSPTHGTWFDHGAPNNPLHWLGGDPSTYARHVLDPPAGAIRGAWQESVSVAWVQAHTVAGVNYIDIIYTCFLAWNGSIGMIAGQGEHPNDVETFAVRLVASDLDHPVRYFFQQHGGFAWYEPSVVEKSGDQVMVYLARQSHECYPHAGRFTRVFGAADDLCDTDGVAWNPDATYFDRPQGIDVNGIDIDALRCSLMRNDPNDVVLVSLDDPQPLWHYVGFPFLAPPGPATDDDFVHQGLPLFTDKWWPDEGPAGDAPPLSTKAAGASAPGVPNAYFANVAPYLGPDPMPTCGATAAVVRRPKPRRAALERTYTPTSSDTILGRDLGGPPAQVAPNATFIDWRGGIGRYVLDVINTLAIPVVMRALADPMPLPPVSAGPITLKDITLVGLHTLTFSTIAATGAAQLHVSVAAPALTLRMTLDVSGGPRNVPLSASLEESAIDTMVEMITPVAVPATDAQQWYVPYVGPAPYSYLNTPFEMTWKISSATVTTLTIAAEQIAVEGGGAVIDTIVDLILALVRGPLLDAVAGKVREQINEFVRATYAGKHRFG